MESKMTNPKHADRREFIKGAAVAGTGLSLAGGESLLGKDLKKHPVQLGVLGLGMMGARHITRLLRLQQEGIVKITAVCDVFSKRLDTEQNRTGADAYQDYRKMLAAKNVEAVLVATPDHWHSKQCVEAMDAGKDVYCEKPMTHWRNLQEARDIVEAVRRNKSVLQVGVQMTSDARFEMVQQPIQEGVIGKLMRAQASYVLNHDHHKYSTHSKHDDAIPGETLDWDTWLGPAPKRPYEPARFASFRSFWDYSGGLTTDLLAHRLTPLVKAMGLGFPRRVAATGGQYILKDGREIPDHFHMSVEYPDGPNLMLVTSMGNNTNLPMLIDGPKGTIHLRGSGYEIHAANGEQVAAENSTRAPSDTEQRVEHLKDFFTCVRTRKTPRCDATMGYHVMVALHMGIRSYLEGKVLEFDPETEMAKVL